MSLLDQKASPLAGVIHSVVVQATRRPFASQPTSAMHVCHCLKATTHSHALRSLTYSFAIVTLIAIDVTWSLVIGCEWSLDYFTYIMLPWPTTCIWHPK